MRGGEKVGDGFLGGRFAVWSDIPGAQTEEQVARGIRLHGDRLRPAEEAKTVLVRDGEILVSDGPFAETKEIICGYDMLECGSLEEAVQVASAHPVARFGKIEVRAVWP